MNQGILLLLLAAVTNMQGNNTYTGESRREGEIRPLRVDLGSLRSINPHHMIRNMQGAIDVLQRVEQIGALADFSTVRRRGTESRRGEERAPENNRDTYIGGIKESFGNVRDFLGGVDPEERGQKELNIYKAEMAEQAESAGSAENRSASGDSAKANAGLNLNDLAGLAGLLGGGGMSQEGLLSAVGSLIGNMNANSSANKINNNNSNSANRQNNTGENSNGGLDIEKLMKMVNMISTLNKK